MKKLLKGMVVGLVACMALTMVVYAQQQQAAAKKEVTGNVKEIAADGTYIMIDTTKILTTKEFLEGAYLEVGDKVKITAEESPTGLKAIDYEYIFERPDTTEVTADEEPQLTPQ